MSALSAGADTQPLRQRLEKWLAGAFSLALIAAVLLPIRQNWRKPSRDSFPLSHYPMFSAKRPKRVRQSYLIGIDADGNRCYIPYSYLGAGGLNQVRRQLNRVVRSGRADSVCQQVAARIGQQAAGPYAKLVRIEVVTGEYRLNDYFRGEKEPLAEHVHATIWLAGEKP